MWRLSLKKYMKNDATISATFKAMRSEESDSEQSQWMWCNLMMAQSLWTHMLWTRVPLLMNIERRQLHSTKQRVSDNISAWTRPNVTYTAGTDGRRALKVKYFDNNMSAAVANTDQHEWSLLAAHWLRPLRHDWFISASATGVSPAKCRRPCRYL